MFTDRLEVHNNTMVKIQHTWHTHTPPTHTPPHTHYILSYAPVGCCYEGMC